MPHATRFRPLYRSLLSTAAAVVASLGALTLVSFLLAAPSGAAAVASSAHGAPIKVASASKWYADSQSDNWSGYGLGYLSSETLYTSIKGTWIVPKATQHTKGQAEYGATWIGIGGGCYNTSCTSSDETLIQAGTEEDVSTAGKASYSAWYELIPETSVTESIAVHPGDTIKCSIVSTSPGEWTITLSDTTDKKQFTESTAYPSDESTAEWIVETPVIVSTSGGSGVASLPNLGKVKFVDAAVNGKPAGLVPADAIQLVNSDSDPIATPSNPYSKGTAFIDCTYASTCKS
jgi:Peptidase A4 family